MNTIVLQLLCSNIITLLQVHLPIHYSCECSNNNNNRWDHDGGYITGEYQEHLPLKMFEVGDTGASTEALRVWAGPLECTHTTVGKDKIHLRRIIQHNYLPQGKVMFSEMSVCS